VRFEARRALVFALMLAVVGALGATEAGREATRAAMRKIFADMRVLLPLSASTQRFGAPESQETIRTALRDLSAHAAALSSHVGPDDPRFRHLGSTLARDARDALWTYENGQPETAQFLIHQLTESCVSCHSRLPSGDSPLAEGFLAKGALAGLSPQERAGLQLATRRFGEALVTYESILASPQYSPAALLDPITDYLIISVRVKQEPERAIPVFEAFAKRPDLWRYLRLDVAYWIASLRRLGPLVGEAPDLAGARALLEEARREIRFPADRRALVHYVVASSILHRYVEANTGSRKQVAEAYYLLGIIESRIGRNEWVSQAGALLEASIRLAPKAPFAETAYAILEEETLLDYGGALGEALPPDVAANLKELRNLIDE
jgi:tetratricopeptide (TPR) repeat protein